MQKELFPTLLFQEALYPESSRFLNELRAEAFDLKENDLIGQQWSERSYVNGYTSYSSIDQLFLYSSQLEKLKLKIDQSVRKSVQGLGWQVEEREIQLSKMWVNIMSAGAAHSGHIHPYSVLSGTFYIAVPKNAGAIRFEDPRLSHFMNRPQIKPRHPESFQNFHVIQPRPGELVLFESWLRHEVLASRSTEPRISISFNYDWVTVHDG